MDDGRSQHDKRAETGTGRKTCAAVDRLEKSAATHNGRRRVPIKDRAVYFPILAAAPSRLGVEGILRDLVSGFDRTK